MLEILLKEKIPQNGKNQQKMGKHEKNYITQITPELIKLISWNAMIIAKFRANNILAEEDTAELVSQ